MLFYLIANVASLQIFLSSAAANSLRAEGAFLAKPFFIVSGSIFSGSVGDDEFRRIRAGSGWRQDRCLQLAHGFRSHKCHGGTWLVDLVGQNFRQADVPALAGF